MLILSHGKADVEYGFNLNNKLLVESMQEQSLIAQKVINARMLSNGYLTHNVPITKDLTHSLPMHPFKRKNKYLKKTEKNEKIDYLNEELT